LAFLPPPHWQPSPGSEISAEEYKSLGIAEGDKLVLTPRHARVFVDAGQGI